MVLRFKPSVGASSGSVNPFSHTGAESKMSYFVNSAVSSPAPYSAARPPVVVSGVPF